MSAAGERITLFVDVATCRWSMPWWMTLSDLCVYGQQWFDSEVIKNNKNEDTKYSGKWDGSNMWVLLENNGVWCCVTDSSEVETFHLRGKLS